MVSSWAAVDWCFPLRRSRCATKTTTAGACKCGEDGHVHFGAYSCSGPFFKLVRRGIHRCNRYRSLITVSVATCCYRYTGSAAKPLRARQYSKSDLERKTRKGFNGRSEANALSRGRVHIFPLFRFSPRYCTLFIPHENTMHPDAPFHVMPHMPSLLEDGGEGDVSFCERPWSYHDQTNPNEPSLSVRVGALQQLPVVSNHTTASVESMDPPQVHRLNMTAEVAALLEHLDQFSFARSPSKTTKDDGCVKSSTNDIAPHSAACAPSFVQLIPLSPNDENSSVSTIPEAPPPPPPLLATTQTDDARFSNPAISRTSTSTSTDSTLPQQCCNSEHDNNDLAHELLRQARTERQETRLWAAKFRQAVLDWATSVELELRTKQSPLPHISHAPTCGIRDDNNSNPLLDTINHNQEYQESMVKELREQWQCERSENQQLWQTLHEIVRRQQDRIVALENTVSSLLPLHSPPPDQQHEATTRMCVRQTAHHHLPLSPERLYSSHKTLPPTVSFSPLSNDTDQTVIVPPDTLPVSGASTSPGLATPFAARRSATPGTSSHHLHHHRPCSRTRSPDRRAVLCQEDCQIITYRNGAVKEIYHHPSRHRTSDGDDEDVVVVEQVIRFPNGDVQTTTSEDEAYYFAASGIVRVVQRNRGGNKDSHASPIESWSGTVQYHFPNGQIEEHDSRGAKVVWYPDGTVHCVERDDYDDDDRSIRQPSLRDPVDPASAHLAMLLEDATAGYSFTCTV
jgi:T-complex protein 10 C-terminus